MRRLNVLVAGYSIVYVSGMEGSLLHEGRIRFVGARNMGSIFFVDFFENKIVGFDKTLLKIDDKTTVKAYNFANTET